MKKVFLMSFCIMLLTVANCAAVFADSSGSDTYDGTFSYKIPSNGVTVSCKYTHKVLYTYGYSNSTNTLKFTSGTFSTSSRVNCTATVSSYDPTYTSTATSIYFTRPVTAILKTSDDKKWVVATAKTRITNTKGSISSSHFETYSLAKDL